MIEVQPSNAPKGWRGRQHTMSECAAPVFLRRETARNILCRHDQFSVIRKGFGGNLSLVCSWLLSERSWNGVGEAVLSMVRAIDVAADCATILVSLSVHGWSAAQ